MQFEDGTSAAEKPAASILRAVVEIYPDERNIKFFKIFASMH
jgi:hypothetical protein